MFEMKSPMDSRLIFSQVINGSTSLLASIINKS